MSEIHQCPRCDLRFADRWELNDHVAADHPVPGPVDDIPDPPGGRHDDAAVEAGLRRLPGWAREGDAIVKTFELPSFRDAIAFVNRVADAAEQADHHPDLDIRYRNVRALLTTHSEGGLTAKDLRLAEELDRCAASS